MNFKIQDFKTLNSQLIILKQQQCCFGKVPKMFLYTKICSIKPVIRMDLPAPEMIYKARGSDLIKTQGEPRKNV